MTPFDTQLGGGYVYQWQCAIELALECFEPFEPALERCGPLGPALECYAPLEPALENLGPNNAADVRCELGAL